MPFPFELGSCFVDVSIKVDSPEIDNTLRVGGYLFVLFIFLLYISNLGFPYKSQRACD